MDYWADGLAADRQAVYWARADRLMDRWTNKFWLNIFRQDNGPNNFTTAGFLISRPAHARILFSKIKIYRIYGPKSNIPIPARPPGFLSSPCRGAAMTQTRVIFIKGKFCKRPSCC